MANFGEIVIPETEERNAVKIYHKFSEDRLMKQLEQLQAIDLLLQEKKTIITSRKPTTGKLGSPSL